MTDRVSSPPFDVPIAVDPADIDVMHYVDTATCLKWVQHAVIEAPGLSEAPTPEKVKP